jgi:hypothetical protein
VEKAYNDIIAKRGAWMPWTVCGPARYNSRRNSAKADRQMDAERDWSEKIERYIENTLFMIADAIPHDEMIAEYRSGKRREAISSDDPDALEKLSARLEGMQERHEEATRQNAYWRKRGTMNRYPGVTDDEAARRDAEINAVQLPCWRVPYPFSANDTAEMRRIQERIENIQRQREAGNTEQEYDGFTVERADGRINIAFGAKPEVEARDILKSNGFRWSPKAQVWTRKLTDNAVYAVERFVVPGLLDIINK